DSHAAIIRKLPRARIVAATDHGLPDPFKPFRRCSHDVVNASHIASSSLRNLIADASTCAISSADGTNRLTNKRRLSSLILGSNAMNSTHRRPVAAHCRIICGLWISGTTPARNHSRYTPVVG